MNVSETAEKVVTTASTTTDMSMWSLVMSSDFIGKAVILMLICASIWSWAIIIHKLRLFYATKNKMRHFENLFLSGAMLDDLYASIMQKNDNPLASIFLNTVNEHKKKAIQSNDIMRTNHKERLLNIMHLIRNREMDRLESSLGFLATVGSSAPFIGLFGTVWGIMHSFQSIAVSKNTTLAVVAPGIAEALLATAIGLFVAIPATIFYNYLSSDIDNINNKIDDFIMQLNNLLSRSIDEGNK